MCFKFTYFVLEIEVIISFSVFGHTKWVNYCCTVCNVCAGIYVGLPPVLEPVCPGTTTLVRSIYVGTRPFTLETPVTTTTFQATITPLRQKPLAIDNILTLRLDTGNANDTHSIAILTMNERLMTITVGKNRLHVGSN